MPLVIVGWAGGAGLRHCADPCSCWFAIRSGGRQPFYSFVRRGMTDVRFGAASMPISGGGFNRSMANQPD